MQVRTRFAPSPTGYLHLGGLRTALYAYLFAKKYGGTFILRIEDTDQEREVAGAAKQLQRSLKLAGLDWDEGPDVGGGYGPYVQTERRSLYAPYARQLIESGAAYPCFCTKERLDGARKSAEQKGQTFKYDKRCKAIPKDEAKRRIDAGEPYVVRLDMPAEGTITFDDIHFGHIEVECQQLDDIILMKADGLPTYNFANVIDDHLMGITHVLRGTEYLSSTPKYNLLYEAFGWEKPVYVHLPLVMADAARKLSKRYGDPSFEDLLSEGYLADAVVNYIALLGWNPGDDREFFTLPELVQAFTLEGLSKSPSIFDKTKLTWMNGEYTRRLTFHEFYTRSKKYIEEILPGKDTEYLAKLLHGRVDIFTQIPNMIDFLRELPEYDTALYIHKKMKTDGKNSAEALSFVLPILQSVADWTEPAIKEALLFSITNAGRKNGAILWPLRVALSGLMSTPGGATEIAYLLGKDETIARVNKAVARLNA
jgi:glutamyl-tRNA synthetase